MKYSQAVLLLAILAIGCKSGGNGGNNNGGPTDPSGGNQPPVATTTITITAAGVNPKNITVALGARVTFINSDNVPHEMNSDPHPDHGDCPALDSVGFLTPGQTKQTGNLTVARTCGFHDHNRPETASLQGTIVVQ